MSSWYVCGSGAEVTPVFFAVKKEAEMQIEKLCSVKKKKSEILSIKKIIKENTSFRDCHETPLAD